MIKHNRKSLATKYHFSLVFVGAITALTLLSGLLLTSPRALADASGGITLSVEVPAICSLTIDDTSHSATINPGDSGLIGSSNLKAICNDPGGLAIYATGYTNDSYGNANLTASAGGTSYNIATFATPSGTTPSASEWNMTLTPISGTYAPTIVTGYDSAHAIPEGYTKVAYRNSMTDFGTGATGANFTAAFNAYISNTQAAGVYTGKVKFLLVHPNINAIAPETILTLQDVDSWGTSVGLGEEVQAIDERDGQVYKVKRLKMNAAGTETMLWMSNLNLGAEPLADGVTQLDSTNTNLASGVSAISKNTFEGWIKSSASNYSFTDPELIPITASNSATNSASDPYNNQYGTIYNFAAASAGTYTYDGGSGTGNATSDLCPAGWRMPTGGETGEQKTLIDAYGLNDGNYGYQDATGLTFMQQNLNFSLAGYTDSGAPGNQGTGGLYWSSTYGGTAVMNMLILDDDNLIPATIVGRSRSASIRCVAEDPQI